MTRASIVKPAQRNRAMMEDRSTRSAVASDEIDNLARLFANLAIAAGALAMEVLDNSSIESRLKSDALPVTEADERVEAYLAPPHWRAIIARRARRRPGDARRAARRARSTAGLRAHRPDRRHARVSRPAAPEFTINVGAGQTAARRCAERRLRRRRKGRVWFAGARGVSPLTAASRRRSLPPAAGLARALERGRGARGGTGRRSISRSHLDAETDGLPRRSQPIAAQRARRLLAQILRRSPTGDRRRLSPLRSGPWNGTPRPATPSCARPAAPRSTPHGAPLRYGKARDADYRNGPFVAWADPARRDTAAALP